jgi:hypothetical protein
MNETILPTPEPIPCLRHPQTETRLRCTECESPICPQCMVMYEVGFKCPSCAKKRPSHSEKVEAIHYVIGISGGLCAGQLYGWLFPWFTLTFGFMRFFGIPVLCWLLSYVAGLLISRGLQRLLRYKHHVPLTSLILLAATLSLLGTPLQESVQSTWEIISSALNAGGDTSIELFLLGNGLILFSAVFFLRGLSQPFRKI